MASRIQQQWESLAQSDPLWAILSDPRKQGGRWDPETFFETGRREIAAVFERLSELGVEPRRGRALDFGCGVGRLTQALAERFDSADGVDIAPTMVTLARNHNARETCRYHVVAAPPLPFEDGAFDFVLSLIVLQHMPPRDSLRNVAEFLRVLAPGGVLYVQHASRPRLPAGAGRFATLRHAAGRALPEPVRRLTARLRGTAVTPAGFEMHGVPRRRLERLLETRLRLVDVSPDLSAGEGWTSYRYCAVKP